LVASGGLLAYRGLGLNLQHLLYSAYGRTLIAKVIMFVIVLTLGSYNRYWLVPQFRIPTARNALLQTVRVECCLLIVVLGLAALLANTPPVH
jgi:putative copper export protein